MGNCRQTFPCGSRVVEVRQRKNTGDHRCGYRGTLAALSILKTNSWLLLVLFLQLGETFNSPDRLCVIMSLKKEFYRIFGFGEALASDGSESLCFCCLFFFFLSKQSTSVKTQMNQLLCHFLSLLSLPSFFPSFVWFVSPPPAEITVLNIFGRCNSCWDTVRIAVLWSSSHYLKFSFATEKFTVGLKHINYCSDQFTFLSSSIEVCFRPSFFL